MSHYTTDLEAAEAAAVAAWKEYSADLDRAEKARRRRTLADLEARSARAASKVTRAAWWVARTNLHAAEQLNAAAATIAEDNALQSFLDHAEQLNAAGDRP